MLLAHNVFSAFCFAFASAGSNSEARIAIIAITTSSSISVNPREWVHEFRRTVIVLMLFGCSCFLITLPAPASTCALNRTPS